MNYKRTIFMTIIILASGYSYKVYTGGTDNDNGLLKSDAAIRGKLTWQEYNCSACHQLYGLGGYMGPDLTNEIALKGKDYARAFISGGSLKMPDLHLNKEQQDDIIEYLICLNRSGEYPVKKPNLTPWGDIDITQSVQH
jgi:nitric oxide reductase subunit C